MASGVVRGAISTVLDDPKLVQSSRTDEMRQFGKNFLAKVVENDKQIELFDTFCETIISEINKIFSGLSKGSVVHPRRGPDCGLLSTSRDRQNYSNRGRTCSRSRESVEIGINCLCNLLTRNCFN